MLFNPLTGDAFLEKTRKSQFSFYRLQYEAVTTSHLLNQTTHNSIANLCKWCRVMIQSLPNAVGMSPRPLEPGAAFGSFKEFIIGSKFSIQLLQTFRIDDFFQKVLSTYIQHYYFYEWMPTNVASIISRFFWQYDCLRWSAQSYLALITPSWSLANSEWFFQVETGLEVFNTWALLIGGQWATQAGLSFWLTQCSLAQNSLQSSRSPGEASFQVLGGSGP